MLPSTLRTPKSMARLCLMIGYPTDEIVTALMDVFDLSHDEAQAKVDQALDGLAHR